MDVYNDFSNDDVTWKTGASGVGAAAGAGGAAALLALGVSNPIGWVALGVGALALGARAVGEAMEEHEKAIHGNTDKFKEQTKGEMALREQELSDKMEELKVLRKNVEESTDIQERKDMLIKAGIATEEELADKKYDELDAMTALIDVYTTKTKQLTEEENNTYLALQSIIDEEQAGIADKTNQFMDELTAGWGTNKNAKELTDDQKNLFLSMARALDIYGKENADTLTDEQKELVQKAGRVKTVKDIDEMNELIDALDWHNGTSRQLMSDAVRSGNGASIITQTEGGRSILGVENQYQIRDSNKATEILSGLKEASEEKDKGAVESYVSMLKQAGYTKIEYFGDKKDTVMGFLNNVGIDKYRTGLDRVPYDDYPALLHEGEAVLTADTAFELRNMMSTMKDIQNGSMVEEIASGMNSMSNEYKEAREDSAKIERAIQEQTSALVQRLDAIYQKIPSGSGTPEEAAEIMPRKISTKYITHDIPF